MKKDIRDFIKKKKQSLDEDAFLKLLCNIFGNTKRDMIKHKSFTTDEALVYAMIKEFRLTELDQLALDGAVTMEWYKKGKFPKPLQ